MRTTVRLDEHLLQQAKQHAAASGTTLTAVLEQALRESLARRPATARLEPVQLKTFRGGGVRPGVDLDGSASLLDLMVNDDETAPSPGRSPPAARRGGPSRGGALAFAEQLRARPNCVPVAPGRRHWGIVRGLCDEAGAKGNIVPDAYLAAMAIESGCEWITTDRDFSRFRGLRRRHPLR